jgi:hypothetical protein
MLEMPGVGIIGFCSMGKVPAYCYRSLPVFCDPVPVQTKLVGLAEIRARLANSKRIKWDSGLSRTIGENYSGGMTFISSTFARPIQCTRTNCWEHWQLASAFTMTTP